MANEDRVLYLDVDNVYGADELGLPFRDIMGEGVVAAGDMMVSQRAAGANMSVDVAAGACWIVGDDSDLQPTYRYREPAVTNVAVTAADATNPRIDRVVAEVLDATFAGVSKLGRIRVVAGTPTSGADLSNLTGAAAVPNTAYLLANVLVPAGATSITNADLSDVRDFAEVGGGDAQGAAGVGVVVEGTLVAERANINLTHVADAGVAITGADAPGFDQVNVNFAVDLTNHESHLTSDVAITANTFADGPSVSLEAGTWLVMARGLIANTNSGDLTFRLWDGSTVYDEDCPHAPAGERVSGNVKAIVTVGSTTTVKLSATSTASGATLKDAGPSNATADKATTIVAVKIG